MSVVKLTATQERVLAEFAAAGDNGAIYYAYGASLTRNVLIKNGLLALRDEEGFDLVATPAGRAWLAEKAAAK